MKRNRGAIYIEPAVSRLPAPLIRLYRAWRNVLQRRKHLSASPFVHGVDVTERSYDVYSLPSETKNTIRGNRVVSKTKLVSAHVDKSA